MIIELIFLFIPPFIDIPMFNIKYLDKSIIWCNKRVYFIKAA